MTERYEDLARFEIGPYTRSSKAVFRKTDTKPPFQPKELSNRPEHDLSDNYALCGKETPSLPPVTQHNTFSTANGWSLFQLPEWSLFRLPQTAFGQICQSFPSSPQCDCPWRSVAFSGQVASELRHPYDGLAN